MNLDEYLENNGIKHTFFAKKAEISIKTLYLVLQGKDMMLTTAMKIVQATNNQVTIEDLWHAIKKEEQA